MRLYLPWHVASLAQFVENGLVHYHKLAVVGHEDEVTAAGELVYLLGLQFGVVISDAGFEKFQKPPPTPPTWEGQVSVCLLLFHILCFFRLINGLSGRIGRTGRIGSKLNKPDWPDEPRLIRL